MRSSELSLLLERVYIVSMLWLLGGELVSSLIYIASGYYSDNSYVLEVGCRSLLIIGSFWACMTRYVNLVIRLLVYILWLMVTRAGVGSLYLHDFYQLSMVVLLSISILWGWKSDEKDCK